MQDTNDHPLAGGAPYHPFAPTSDRAEAMRGPAPDPVELFLGHPVNPEGFEPPAFQPAVG